VGAAAFALGMIAEDCAALASRLVSEAGMDGIYYSTMDIGAEARTKLTDEKRRQTVEQSDMATLAGINAVGKLNILHICGWGGHRNVLKHFVNYPAQVVNWAVNTEGVSLGEGKKLFPGKTVMGGFGNTTADLLYKGSKEEIQAETRRLLAESGRTGVILGADCTVPRDIPVENLNCVREAAGK
jgi:uroporphyrinogen decarboxylase